MRYFYNLSNFWIRPFLFLLAFCLSFNNQIKAQCANPTLFQLNTVSDSSVSLQWSPVTSAVSYRVSLKKEETNWQFATIPIDIPSNQTSIVVSDLEEFTNYQYRIKTICDSGLSSSWSVPQQFTTNTSLSVDCSGTLEGDAFLDDCGNCVGGNTGNEPCIDFTPSITLSLSQFEAQTLTDISFTVSQDANEPDMLSSVFVSDGGNFDFSSLSSSQVVGQGSAIAGGGFLSSSFTLSVDFIIDANNVTLTAIDDNDGTLVGTFELQNSSSGVQVLSVAPQDGNNITTGNSLDVTLSNLFVTPTVGDLTFVTTITSETGPVDSQEFIFEIGSSDCNGDFNGDAFLDDCGNCVGGNAGNEPCIDFTPSITLSLSQFEAQTLTDISFTVSQDANEPDMLSSVFVSDGGNFDFSSLSSSQVVGQGSAIAGGGFLSSSFTLSVDFIIDANNVTLTAIDDNDGTLVGTFELQNSSSGVQVLSVAPQDGNNITTGNSLDVTLSNLFVTPTVGDLTFVTTITSETGPVDSQEFIFEIGSSDCNGDFNGDAFLDDCGNCVGGNAGNEPCIDFTPSITLSLSQFEAQTLTDISFTVSQDANEPDMLSSVFVSDGGNFDFSSLSSSQVVGQGSAIAGGGFLSSSFTLSVDFIIDANNVTLTAIDDNDGTLVGTFELQNSSSGVQVLSVAPQDGNNITTGNSLDVTLSNLFVTPTVGDLTFVTTITSETGPVDSQEFIFEIGSSDCNGDFNGDAFLDDCGNCVGGNTGNEPCIDFAPSVLLELSTTDCNESADISLTISQSANQPDMSTSLLVTDGGSFDFNGFEVGQNVGSVSLIAAGGDISFNAVLIITSFPSVNQAILSAVNSEDGSIMGSFTISNIENGVSVVANPSYNDGNNVTNGNVSNLIINGLFVNPDSQVLNFYITTNSENNDTDSQTISLNILCPCNLTGDANCDNIVNLADLTLVLNNWLQNVTTPGTNGDVVGSNDGFVNLSDLTLVLNNWLSVN
jgi:hypothetical protein